MKTGKPSDRKPFGDRKADGFKSGGRKNFGPRNDGHGKSAPKRGGNFGKRN